VLQPVLDRISLAALEISSVAVLDGDDVVFIARSSPTRIFTGGVDIGYRLPSFCTAVGRALLGRLDDAELKQKLTAMRREALTPQTVTDPKRLIAAIAADRKQGYSLVDREAEPHFRSISVPVRRYDDTIAAAINIGAHVDRISTQEMVKRFLPLLREGATEVMGQLI
jgi:IclR family transcriptional regulator, pca regulon regulatory protein